MSCRRGKICSVQPLLLKGKLKILAEISTEEGRIEQAFIPDRETAALLPRSLLSGQGTEVPLELLDTIGSLIRKMAVGRQVRMWSYQNTNYISFLSWRSVRFVSN